MKITTPDRSELCAKVGALRSGMLEPKIIQAKEHFARKLSQLDPYYPWPKFPEEFSLRNEAWVKRLVSTFPQINYEGERDLFCLEAAVASDGIRIHFHFEFILNHCPVITSLPVFRPWREEEEILLRAIGVMREEREYRNYSETRTVVSCHL